MPSGPTEFILLVFILRAPQSTLRKLDEEVGCSIPTILQKIVGYEKSKTNSTVLLIFFHLMISSKDFIKVRTVYEGSNCFCILDLA